MPRITLFQYEDWIENSFKPYSLPLRTKWLKVVSFPEITDKEFKIVKDWTLDEVILILNKYKI